MFYQIWDWIKRLFGIKKSATADAQIQLNQEFAGEYLDISKINFNAIFSNQLATLATADSDVQVPPDNKRAELLGALASNVWGKVKKMVSMALGTGGCLIVPYVKNGEILYDIVAQDRLCIHKKNGERITSATVLADVIVQNNVAYCRFTNYDVENNTLHITNRVTTSTGSPAMVEEWENIQDLSISNVDRVLFGFIKSPVDNRRSGDNYGVPVTFGCQKIMEEIEECLVQIKEEFALKQVRVQMDERMFDFDPKTGERKITSKLFWIGKGDGKENVFNIFDPAIRESSYYNRLTQLFELLEKQVGTSKGILTTPETRGATATEIKAAIYNTYALVCDIRKSVEKGLNDYLYACDVLANYYNLTPPGEYVVTFDWSTSLIESSSETWAQLKDGKSLGIRKKAELRAWQTGETLDEAQKVIEEIEESEPDMQTVLGMSE